MVAAGSLVSGGTRMMFDHRPSRRRKGCALVVALGVAAAACGGGTVDDEPSATDVAGMMNAAMGGTQAVQDFLVHLDMAVNTDDGPVSYYEEVLDTAISGSADPTALVGGFTFARVTGLDGRMIDSVGDEIESLSLDYGLLGVSADRFDGIRSRLVQALVAIGEEDAGSSIAATDAGRSQMLVELITADYTLGRTHAAPGDLAAVDLTFVPTIAPGDSAMSVYVFGQTLPGEPDVEVGMSPHELFVYRWNSGLISFLGSDKGLSPVSDANVEMVEGSTVRTQQVKASAARLFGVDVGRELAEEALATTPYFEYFRFNEVEVREGANGWVSVRERGTSNRPIALPRGLVVGVMALDVATQVCLDLLPGMLRRNQAEAAGAAAARVVVDAVADTGLDVEIEEILYGRDSEAPVAELCGDVDPPEPKSAAGTYGDVHITTFDGWSYDNQAAGEFLVFDNGTATVQMRSAPWPGSDAVSVVTAVAVRAGGHAVSMHQDGRIWIDGGEPAIGRGETIAVGDAALLWTGAAWVVVWPDGTEIRVSGGGPNVLPGAASEYHPLMMLITVTGPDALGMLGSPDDDGRNDWVTRSGEQLDADIRFDFERFYPTYIDTWRISDDESLFHYEDGETTATFTVDGFPRVQYDVADLDPDAKAEAEAVCVEGGVERADMLEGCILDVALTGDVGFVQDTYAAQLHTSEASVPDETVVVDASPPADGESVLSVGPLTVRFGAEPPVVVPNFPGQWQCQAAEGTFAATSRFQETEDRQYEITVDYLDADASRDGTERFTMVVRRNSDPIAWMQTTVDPMPGSLDSVDLRGSTLTATGTALLNDPYDAAVFPGGASFGSATFEPFRLVVHCDR